MEFNHHFHYWLFPTYFPHVFHIPFSSLQKPSMALVGMGKRWVFIGVWCFPNFWASWVVVAAAHFGFCRLWGNPTELHSTWIFPVFPTLLHVPLFLSMFPIFLSFPSKELSIALVGMNAKGQLLGFYDLYSCWLSWWLLHDQLRADMKGDGWIYYLGFPTHRSKK